MTDKFALFGNPIDHSPSPAMHNAAFEALKLDAEYQLRPTTEAEVDIALQEVRDRTWLGANVTTPLKEIVANRVKCVGEAERAGAVNTLWVEKGQLYGELTDIDGIVAPIRERGIASSGEALVIGSGGAARAATVALDGLGMRIHILARRPNAAQRLLDEVAPTRPGSVFEMGSEKLPMLWPLLRVIIQCTPVGRDGRERHDLPWKQTTEGCVAFDMLYLPRETPFLIDAACYGALLVEGWEMLLYQGAAAFSRWTECDAPLHVMRRAVLDHIIGEGHTTS